MRAWVVARPGPLASGPLRLVERPVREPGPFEVLVAVAVCGVCRTDLHLAEGDLPPRRPDVVPGHEVVGRVAKAGAEVTRFREGDRIGVAWLRGTCGVCSACRRGAENLCTRSIYTGWDDDGGYADYVLVPEQFAYALPAATGSWPDEKVAPLLCAGIVGYRALRRAQLPPGGRLGVYGFGASAHLVAQVAMAEGAAVHVLTRSQAARDLAMSLGVASVGDAYAKPPEPLDAAVLFAPVGDLVPVALSALDGGGTLAVAGIHLSDIPELSYEQHLFRERSLRSVTANTRADGEEFMRLALRLGLHVTTTAYDLLNADQALADLAGDRVTGAAVLHT